MRSIWNATVSLGRLQIPVGLVPAQQRATPSFRSLHEPCGVPVNEQQLCPACGTVEPEPLAKGWPVAGDGYVTVTAEELAALAPQADRTIAVERVVALADVDTLLVDRAYHLLPAADLIGRRGYLLLVRALERNEAGAVCRFALRDTEQVGLIRARAGTLLLSTLFLAEDIRPADEIKQRLARLRVDERELDLAGTLLDRLAGPLAPSLHSGQRERVRAMLEAKAAELKLQAPRTVTVDAGLEGALEESIRGAKRPPGRRPRRISA